MDSPDREKMVLEADSRLRKIDWFQAKWLSFDKKDRYFIINQIIALIEPRIAYWREKCYNDTMSAKASGWNDCVKFYGIKEE